MDKKCEICGGSILGYLTNGPPRYLCECLTYHYPRENLDSRIDLRDELRELKERVKELEDNQITILPEMPGSGESVESFMARQERLRKSLRPRTRERKKIPEKIYYGYGFRVKEKI